MKQKKRRWVKLLLILIFAGLLSAGGINWFVVRRSGKEIQSLQKLASQKSRKADAVVVLGAKVRKDGSMSLMLKERVDLGLSLIHI